MTILNIVTKLRLFQPAICRRTAHTYIVLVPEIGDDLPQKNPLLKENGLPEFNNMSIEKCVATIGKQAYDLEKTVQNIAETIASSTAPTNETDIFEDILNPVEQMEIQLETTWGIAKTLYLGNSSLMPTKSYLIIHNRARKAITSKFNSLEIVQQLSKFQNAPNRLINEQQQRLLNKFILESKLNGVELDVKKKEILTDVLHKLQQEKKKFKEKLEISTNQFSHTITDYNVVREFPADLIRHMAVDSKNPSMGPWKVTLQPHIYYKFLEYCQVEELRWNVWQANVLKSGGYANRYLSNGSHIEEIRHLRRMQATLLGFDNYAELSMKTKMAGSVENIHSILDQLHCHAFPQQQCEIEMLQQFAMKNGWNKAILVHDVPYWKRRHLINLYNLDFERIRQYFPLPKVLTGLFQLVEDLFGIKIIERQNDVDKWHENVVFFDIYDVTTQTNSDNEQPIAGIYLDLCSRENSKPFFQNFNGWHVSIRNRIIASNSVPLSALIFNFTSPKTNDTTTPALLSFADVENLFMKFGHALQHLLTKVDYNGVGGLSNIEWDAVEVCGNVLLHFLYHPNVLQSLTAHFATNEPLPDESVHALKEGRKHLAGYELCGELYKSVLDLELHTRKEFWLDITKRLWPQYSPFPLEKKDSHLCSFASIFSGDWAAAYYSHTWSRLLAADVYSAFHEVQNDPGGMKVIGKRFRDTYLALGGSCHPAEVFRRFRGRDPCPKPLLKSLGLIKKPNL